MIVRPRDYLCPDSHDLALSVARQSNVDGTGKTMLAVVDLKGPEVRVLTSLKLKELGSTSRYIANDFIRQQFIPYLKKGDRAADIRLTLSEVNCKTESAATVPAVPVGRRPADSTPPPATRANQLQSPPVDTVKGTLELLWTVVGVAIAAAVVFFNAGA